MCMYMSERCMRQFGYVHIILRPPFESSPNNIVLRHLDDIRADYESHMVPEEY